MDEFSHETSEGLHELEPQITSSDPNERKLARRLRIERRLEALRRENRPKETEDVEDEKEKSSTQIQIEKSIEVLKKLLIEGEERITNIRVASDYRETDRREAEGVGREKIIESLEEEAELAEEAFRQIANKWTTILKSNDPLNIHDELMAQKEKCEELIKQKDGIIAMLKNEITEADKKFANDQKKQMDDICLLTNRIEKQIVLTRRAYREQLKLIEDSMQAERKIMMEVNTRKWDDLYKKRDQEEEAHFEKRYEQIEQFQNKMAELRCEFQEKFRETKIKLERDIDDLEQELERIKTLAILNSEKLDYNYQILKKREDENIIIKSQQKRRINKLQDIVNQLKHRISEYSTETKQQIAKVSTEIAKLQKSILDIESKADNFAEINDTKFNQLWDMNTKRVLQVAQRILTIDRILHEQLLGLEWSDKGILNSKELKRENLPSYRKALKIVEQEAKLLETQRSIIFDSKSGKDTKLDEKKLEMRENLLRHVLEQISDKAGFILEDRLQEILAPYNLTEKALIRVDNVFSALNVTKDSDVDELLKYFLPYTHCPVCSQVQPNISSDSEEKIEESESERSDLTMQEAESVGTAFSETPSDLKGSADTKKAQPAHSLIPVSHYTGQAVQNIMKEVTEPDSEESSTSDIDQDEQDDDEEEEEEEVETLEHHETLDPLENMPPARTGEAANIDNIESVRAKEKSQVDEKLSCQYMHPLVISSVYVLKALRHFVSNYYDRNVSVPTMADRLAKKRNTICRLVDENDIKTYWEHFKNIFSEEQENVWKALSHGLYKYHEILKDRKVLNEEVVELRQQNQELRHLLRRYTEDPEDPTLGPPCSFQRKTPPGDRSRKL